MPEYQVLMKTFVPNGKDYITIVGEDLENQILAETRSFLRIESITTSTLNFGTETVMDVRFESEENWTNFASIIQNSALVLERKTKLEEQGCFRTLEVIGYI